MVLNNFQYFYDVSKRVIADLKANDPKIHTYNINLIGSRLSAKTIQTLKWLIEFSYLLTQEKVRANITIIRHEVSGASETFEELVGVYEDLYKMYVNKINANFTKRTLWVGRNQFKVIGLLSNRKKSVPKLGLARKGVHKKLQINLFEEVTEIPNEKTISIVKQATGGSKIIINIFISNPWIISMWYVKKINRVLPFNKRILIKNGEQFRVRVLKDKKTMEVFHISNHRVNKYLSDAQHQELYNLWDIDENLAMVADLGMPGVAEGLIYAPIMNRILEANTYMPTMEFRAGLDWGTSTGEQGSAVSLIIGRFSYGHQTLQIDNEYYHSNSKNFYKSDSQIIKKLVDKLIDYYKKNRDQIKLTGGYITVFYDHAALALQGLLENELKLRYEKLIASNISIRPCYKYSVPVRIDVVKSIISQGRMRINKQECPHLWSEMEGAMWDETKKVKERPTRLKEDDDCLDALEYLIGKDLYAFADTTFLKFNKLIL